MPKPDSRHRTKRQLVALLVEAARVNGSLPPSNMVIDLAWACWERARWMPLRGPASVMAMIAVHKDEPAVGATVARGHAGSSPASTAGPTFSV